MNRRLITVIFFGLWVSAVSAQTLPTSGDALDTQSRAVALANAIAFREEFTHPIYSAVIDTEAQLIHWPQWVDPIDPSKVTLLMVAKDNAPATWGWALADPPLPLSGALDVLRAHGEAHGISELTTPHLDLTPNEATFLAYAAMLTDDDIVSVANFSLQAFGGSLIVAIHRPNPELAQ